MNTHIPFIDREDELALIKRAIGESGKRRVIYIRAEGGIGKTRLLQEVRARHRQLEQVPALDSLGRKGIKVAVVNEFIQTEWGRRFQEGARLCAHNLGIELIEKDANFDIDQMVQDLDDAINQSPDVLVVRLGTDERLRPGIERAIDQGIPVLKLDNFLPDLENVTSSITTEDLQGAYRSREQLVRDIHYRGKVAAILAQGAPMQERRKNLLDYLLAQYSNIELITEWVVMQEEMVSTGYQAAKTLLHEYPDLKALWVTWDEFARGVVQTLLEEKRTDIGVYSFDALTSSDVKLMIQAGSPWRASVTIDPAVVGREVIYLAALVASERPINEHYSMPTQFVTQEMLRAQGDSWQWVWDELEIARESPLLIPEIIDFDEYAFRNEHSFALKVADLVGMQYFGDFFQELRDFTEIEATDVSSDLIGRQKSDVERAFADCLREVATKRRIVLLLDTAEKAQVLRYVLRIISSIDNVAVLIAGRPDEGIFELLSDALGDQFDTIDLLPLSDKASNQYLQAKQRLLHVMLEPELAEKLLFWSGGKPILIDLAVEWRVRQIPLRWLVEEKLEELGELSEAERQRKEREFESRLVSHIAETRTTLDWLILTLAQVYPLDIFMVGELLELPRDEAERAWRDAQDCVFVKLLPDGKITLHDEMRRLVNAYVWPEVDPDDERRHLISRSAVVYLQQQIESLTGRIQQLGTEEAIAAQQPAGQIDLRWRDLQACKEELWTLKEHLLRHLVMVDLDEAKQLFFDMFTEATNSYRFSSRLNWIALVEPYADELAQEDRYELFIREVKALVAEGRYDEARPVLDDIMKLELEPAQQVEVCIQLANTLIRQGDYNAGIDAFTEATQVSRDHELKRWLVKAENGLGWAYRLTADFEAAREHYEAALGLAIEEDLLHEQSMLYNNLGFLYAYKRDIPQYDETAFRYCNESLRLAQELDDKRGVGCAYSALGCVAFMAGELDQAVAYFQDALDIFEPAQDEEWLGVVYAWLGATYMSGLRADLNQAEKYLLRAREINVPKEQPMVLSRLGLTYLLEGELDKAGDAVKECYRLAQALPDLRYQWISIRDVARLARYKKEYDHLEALEQEMWDYISSHQHVALDQRSFGMLRMELGTLALGQGEEAKAVEHYMEGIKILVSVGRYGGDTPQVFLERLEKQVLLGSLKLVPSQIRALGSQLLSSWQVEGLHIRYPDIREFFSRWAHWEEV